jgi:hypothetical protein
VTLSRLDAREPTVATWRVRPFKAGTSVPAPEDARQSNLVKQSKMHANQTLRHTSTEASWNITHLGLSEGHGAQQLARTDSPFAPQTLNPSPAI